MGDDPIKRKKVIASFILANGWETRREGEKKETNRIKKSKSSERETRPYSPFEAFLKAAKAFCEIFEGFKQIQTLDCPIALWHSYSGCGTIRANYPAVSKAKLTGTILWLKPDWKDNYAAFLRSVREGEGAPGCIKMNGSCSFIVTIKEMEWVPNLQVLQLHPWQRFITVLHFCPVKSHDTQRNREGSVSKLKIWSTRL